MKINALVFFVFLFFVSWTKYFSQKSDVIEFPDVPAAYPGGEMELQKFLAENVKFPEICIDMDAQGRIFMKFTVEKDGSISNIEVEMNNTGCDGFESEARRVISLMPKWSPGEVGGEPKRTICRLPFNFKIKGGNEAESKKESKKLNANWGGFDFGFVFLSFFCTFFFDERIISEEEEEDDEESDSYSESESGSFFPRRFDWLVVGFFGGIVNKGESVYVIKRIVFKSIL